MDIKIQKSITILRRASRELMEVHNTLGCTDREYERNEVANIINSLNRLIKILEKDYDKE